MRGQQERSGSLFSYVSIEDQIPASHPLRRIRKLADQALDRLNPTFCELYASEGQPSMPPEQLLLASLLQAFYGIRSEHLLLDQLHYNLLFRWLVGLSPDDPIWHPTTFTKNRERLLNEQVMGRFLEKLMGAPEVRADSKSQQVVDFGCRRAISSSVVMSCITACIPARID